MKKLFRTSLVLLLAAVTTACATEYVVSPTLPPLNERIVQQLSESDVSRIDATAALRARLLEEALVVFVEGCPDEVIDLVNHCPPGIGGNQTICRGVPGNSKGISGVIKFTSGAQEKDIGIIFELMHPCNQPAGPMANPTSHSKTCTLKGNADEPWTVLKYSVVAPDCPALDPYLIMVR